MIYAPVVIPTLCRFDHFKQCIESLSRCSYADKTEVYVGLDYPAKKSHEEGYLKIRNYLRHVGNMGFKSLYVMEREKNYGFGPQGNASSLINQVAQKYDRYIFSEDDNIFSPNFLEYIDKGLEKYENDDKVFAVIGYCHPYHFKNENNNYFFHRTDVSAWGYGTLIKQSEKMMQFLLEYQFYNSFSLKNMWKIRKYGNNRLFDYITLSLLNKRIKSTNDMVWSNYIQLNDMYVVVPTISKVKNIGWDAEGNSFNEEKIKNKRFIKISKRHNEQIIDTEEHFDYKGTGLEYFDENNKIAVKESDGRISFFRMIYNLFRLLFKHFIKK